mmetsp:Transcript_90900/g.208094  ORF Transcript_90900/g.208094 Transcript_90900/m.208094 type:complete len:277 (+) Transcript_90900:134-964(+)
MAYTSGAQQSHPNHHPRCIYPVHLAVRVFEPLLRLVLHISCLLLGVLRQQGHIAGLVHLQISEIQLLLRVVVGPLQAFLHSAVVVNREGEGNQQGHTIFQSDHHRSVGLGALQGVGHQPNGHAEQHAIGADGRNEPVPHMLLLRPQLVSTRPRVHQRHPAPQAAPNVLRQAIQPSPAQVLRRERPMRVSHEPPDPDGLAEQVPQPVADAVVAVWHVGIRRVVLCCKEEGTEDLEYRRHPVHHHAPEPKPIAPQGEPLLKSSHCGHREKRHIQHRHE